ncbi:hypothetical protein Pan54_44600 [Rubinisphaera italica]|uniref:Uncharacterized protein n=1 Tax=Rubinisphaera italica TaxID=2527969 RepID=A0A5C5XPM8_9PLAN|nr:hypothetical protein Pan54_44600 [Rubinisphaera italica]
MFKIFSSNENHAICIFRLVESFLHSVRHYVLGFTLLLLFVTFYFGSAVPLNCLMNRIGIEEYFFTICIILFIHPFMNLATFGLPGNSISMHRRPIIFYCFIGSNRLSKFEKILKLETRSFGND